jgi:dolichyl-phosphate-mannose--protein O-mannosyl transferase
MPPKKRKTASKKPVTKKKAKKVVTKKKTAQSLLLQPLTLFCLAVVLLLSFLTYFHNFENPQGFYWDENYHIASAQKYQNGIFYMQQHPPLGKLLIALGEELLDASANDEQFISTSKATGNFSDGFSITGYRVIPVFLAWMTAPLLFLVFLLLTRSPLIATLLSFLYVFDNALIVQMRGAMLEGSLLFFLVLTILCFLLLIEKKLSQNAFRVLSILFGIALACTALTKLTGLILILLVPALIYSFLPKRDKIKHFLLLAGIGFLVIFIGVWQIHFSLGKTVNPELSRKGWHGASEEVQSIVREGRQLSPASFPIMLQNSLRYTASFNHGVPKLDLCKPGENGSPFFLWPFGARSINYRWSSAGELGKRYLYLQANPVVWLIGLLSVVVAAALLICPLFCPLKKKLTHPFLLTTFLGLYVSYMLAISQLDRVMYLYHYFPPLLFSFLLFAIVLMEAKQILGWKLNEENRVLLLMPLILLVFLAFLIYRPLTYFQPITDEALKQRSLLRIWNLKCVHCKMDDPLVKPRTCNN